MNQTQANRLDFFLKSWSETRSLTVDLLNSLTDSDLLWSPGKKLGQFWKQFRHLARVQEDYINALDTKKISFTCENKHYDGGPNKTKLIEYLTKVNNLMLSKIQKIDLNENIDWFGEPVNTYVHLIRMESHENLHHGQFIVYFQLLGKKFPDSWSIWGL